MDSIASWLASITWPLVSRVLAALGIGYVTFEGVSSAASGALGYAKSALSGLPVDIALLVAKFGFFDYMSITSGGLMSGIAWLTLKKMAVLAGPGGGGAS